MPEYKFFFWNDPAWKPYIPKNFRRDLAIIAFRAGRQYEQALAESRKKADCTRNNSPRCVTLAAQ